MSSEITSRPRPWNGAVAKDAGRRAIGIEIEERYCEIAAKRLAQETLFGIGVDHV